MAIRFMASAKKVRLHALRAVEAGKLEAYCVASYPGGDSKSWLVRLNVRPAGNELRFRVEMDPREKPPPVYTCGLGIHASGLPFSFGKYVGRSIVEVRLTPRRQ
jgi:hypothetical protein